MSRWLLILGAITLMLFSALPSQAENQRRNLVPVKPAAEVEAQATEQARPASGSAEQPTPADQLYVFWVLGRLISYPFDALESYMKRRQEMPDPEPRAVPAAAPATPNPFDAVKLGQVPPAPPVSSRSWDQ